MAKMCAAPDCERDVLAKGFCRAHYNRVWSHGSVGNAPINHYERHGKTDTSEYNIWRQIMQRCYNPASEWFDSYGARGITVCERWHSPTAFLEDMGLRPTSEHSIERLDNDKGYEPGNCKWGTVSEQQQNKRNTKLNARQVEELREHVRSGGEIKQWSKDRGLSYTTCCSAARGETWGAVYG